MNLAGREKPFQFGPLFLRHGFKTTGTSRLCGASTTRINVYPGGFCNLVKSGISGLHRLLKTAFPVFQISLVSRPVYHVLGQFVIKRLNGLCKVLIHEGVKKGLRYRFLREIRETAHIAFGRGKSGFYIFQESVKGSAHDHFLKGRIRLLYLLFQFVYGLAAFHPCLVIVTGRIRQFVLVVIQFYLLGAHTAETMCHGSSVHGVSPLPMGITVLQAVPQGIIGPHLRVKVFLVLLKG